MASDTEPASGARELASRMSFVLVGLLGLVLGDFAVAHFDVGALGAAPARWLCDAAVLAVVGLLAGRVRSESRRAEEDVVQRDVAERELALQDSYLQQLFTNSPQAIAQLDPDDRIVSVNHAFEKLFGHDADEIRDRGINEILGSAELNAEAASLSEQAHAGQVVHHEGVRRRKDGSMVEVEILGYPISTGDEHIGVYVIYEDITARKGVEKRLQHEATHDALTGLANRSWFLTLLGRALVAARARGAAGFAVLFVDIDRFKIVNDSMGHLAGDLVLSDVAAKLAAVAGPLALVARLGGDEFGVLVEGTETVNAAALVAERVKRELEKPMSLGTHEVILGCSIGIAMNDATFDKAEHLVRNANIAMHRAKLARKPYEVFTPEMHEASLARMRLESDLRQAIEQQQFVLHYQPIVQIAGGEITGVEALVRWMHPTRGLIAPAEFIPLAEETRLIIPMTRWILGEACGFLRRLRDDFPARALSVGVNLSTVEFSDAAIVADIRKAVERAGLGKGALAVEVTESAMMENADAAAVVLSELREAGIAVHVDDFGTGYSSLAYLQRFSVDRLKIDRSFIANMAADAGNLGIVRAVIALAHDLGQKVVAEGVETSEQLEALRRLGCDYAQGFYLARPLVEAELRELVASGKRL